MTTFKKRQPQKKVESRILKEFDNGTLFENANWMVYFNYLKSENPEKAREINEQIEYLEWLKFDNVFEEQQNKIKISQLEKDLERTKERIVFSNYFIQFESEKQIDDFLWVLENAFNQDNIWSSLMATWLRFDNPQYNNLSRTLTDNQLDNMSVEQAIDYRECDNRFSRTREQDTRNRF